MPYKLGLRRPIYWLERHLDLQALICRSQYLSGWIDSNPKNFKQCLISNATIEGGR